MQYFRNRNVYFAPNDFNIRESLVYSRYVLT